MDDDVDIYGDLPSFEDGQCIRKKCTERIQELEKKNVQLEEESSSWKKKFQVLEEEKKTIATNSSSLLKTARAEIARKDRTIQELRQELEDLKFRRGNRGKPTNNNADRSNHKRKNEPKQGNRQITIASNFPIPQREIFANISDEEEADTEQKWEADKPRQTLYGERLWKKILIKEREEKLCAEESKIVEATELSSSNITPPTSIPTPFDVTQQPTDPQSSNALSQVSKIKANLKPKIEPWDKENGERINDRAKDSIKNELPQQPGTLKLEDNSHRRGDALVRNPNFKLLEEDEKNRRHIDPRDNRENCKNAKDSSICSESRYRGSRYDDRDSRDRSKYRKSEWRSNRGDSEIPNHVRSSTRKRSRSNYSKSPDRKFPKYANYRGDKNNCCDEYGKRRRGEDRSSRDRDEFGSRNDDNYKSSNAEKRRSRSPGDRNSSCSSGRSKHRKSGDDRKSRRSRSSDIREDKRKAENDKTVNAERWKQDTPRSANDNSMKKILGHKEPNLSTLGENRVEKDLENDSVTDKIDDDVIATMENLLSQIETQDKFVAMLEGDCGGSSTPVRGLDTILPGSRSFREEKIENIEKFIQDYDENNFSDLATTGVTEDKSKFVNSTISILRTLGMDDDDVPADQESDNESFLDKSGCSLSIDIPTAIIDENLPESLDSNEKFEFQGQYVTTDNEGIDDNFENKAVEKRLIVDDVEEKLDNVDNVDEKSENSEILENSEKAGAESKTTIIDERVVPIDEELVNKAVDKIMIIDVQDKLEIGNADDNSENSEILENSENIGTESKTSMIEERVNVAIDENMENCWDERSTHFGTNGEVDGAETVENVITRSPIVCESEKGFEIIEIDENLEAAAIEEKTELRDEQLTGAVEESPTCTETIEKIAIEEKTETHDEQLTVAIEESPTCPELAVTIEDKSTCPEPIKETTYIVIEEKIEIDDEQLIVTIEEKTCPETMEEIAIEEETEIYYEKSAVTIGEKSTCPVTVRKPTDISSEEQTEIHDKQSTVAIEESPTCTETIEKIAIEEKTETHDEQLTVAIEESPTCPETIREITDVPFEEKSTYPITVKEPTDISSEEKTEIHDEQLTVAVEESPTCTETIEKIAIEEKTETHDEQLTVAIEESPTCPETIKETTDVPFEEKSTCPITVKEPTDISSEEKTEIHDKQLTVAIAESSTCAETIKETTDVPFEEKSTCPITVKEPTDISSVEKTEIPDEQLTVAIEESPTCTETIEKIAIEEKTETHHEQLPATFVEKLTCPLTIRETTDISSEEKTEIHDKQLTVAIEESPTCTETIKIIAIEEKTEIHHEQLVVTFVEKSTCPETIRETADVPFEEKSTSPIIVKEPTDISSKEKTEIHDAQLTVTIEGEPARPQAVEKIADISMSEKMDETPAIELEDSEMPLELPQENGNKSFMDESIEIVNDEKVEYGIINETKIDVAPKEMISKIPSPTSEQLSHLPDTSSPALYPPPSDEKSDKIIDNLEEGKTARQKKNEEKDQIEKFVSKQVEKRPRIPCVPILSLYSRKRRDFVLTDSVTSHVLIKSETLVEKKSKERPEAPTSTENAIPCNKIVSNFPSAESEKPKRQRNNCTVKLEKIKNADSGNLGKERFQHDKENPEVSSSTDSATLTVEKKADNNKTMSGSIKKSKTSVNKAKGLDVEHEEKSKVASQKVENSKHSDKKGKAKNRLKSGEQVSRGALKALSSTSKDLGSTGRKRPCSKEKENQSKEPKMMLIARRRSVHLDDSSVSATLVLSDYDESCSKDSTFWQINISSTKC